VGRPTGNRNRRGKRDERGDETEERQALAQRQASALRSCARACRSPKRRQRAPPNRATVSPERTRRRRQTVLQARTGTRNRGVPPESRERPPESAGSRHTRDRSCLISQFSAQCDRPRGTAELQDVERTHPRDLPCGPYAHALRCATVRGCVGAAPSSNCRASEEGNNDCSPQEGATSSDDELASVIAAACRSSPMPISTPPLSRGRSTRDHGRDARHVRRGPHCRAPLGSRDPRPARGRGAVPGAEHPVETAR
jgi:hypothetical protein